MEDITDANYEHAKKIWKEFKIKSNTLLLSDIYENFRNKCIQIFEFDPAHF